MFKLQTPTLVLGGALLAFGALAANSIAAPDAPASARYSMSPVDGGFVRLDKETGAMSMCKSRGDNWSCEPMADADQTGQKELERLKAENSDLKEEIRRMEEVFGLDGKKKSGEAGDGPGPLAGPPGGPIPKFELPDEKQVDKAIDYLEGMIRKFRERFEDFGDKTDPDRPRGPDNSARPETPTPL